MKVSILIPVYNSEQFLKETIQSALGQSWPDKEIIIVDDGSSDGSLSIAKSFESNQVKVFTQSNGGACKARNRAFAESTGDYIQYLDADDLLSPDKIKYQMALLTDDKSKTVLSCTLIRFYNEEELSHVTPPKRFLDRDWDNPIDWLMHAWMGKGMGQTSTWLTPRALIKRAGPWNESLSINQDGEFFCRVLLASTAIKYSADSLVYYRSGVSNSISQTISARKVADLLQSYKLYEEHILKVDNSIGVRAAIARNYRSVVYTYVDQYPDLAEKASKYFDALDVKNVLIGGKYFSLFSKITGFNTALKVRSWVRRISTKKSTI